MDFKDKLNEYIALLGCSTKELAESVGLSAMTISRYRSGERMPGNKQFAALIAGMDALAKEKGIVGFSAEAAEKELSSCSRWLNFDYEKLRNNFNTLLMVLSVNVSDMSRSTHYDASYISRVRSGQRRPSDPAKFVREVVGFIIRNYTGETEIAAAAELMGCAAKELADESVYFEKLSEWLTSDAGSRSDYTFDFLKKLDAFDIGEYIRAIHFDEIKVPSAPFQLPTSKYYFGLKQMMESEIDFLKATVLGKSQESVILYSDMPMEEMVKDPDFPKKWMFGMAMMLKKGLHLHQIHNIDRSFHEMMLGLESWIPLYMTGQVSPYYLKGVQNNVFLHSLKVSGSAAHAGEAISGYHTDGRYYLTKQKDEIAYYRKTAEHMLRKALPLMDIYRKNEQNRFNAFLASDVKDQGNRRNILSVPPVYTMSDETLTAFLQRRHVSEMDSQQILSHNSLQREYMEAILEHSPVQIEVSVLTKDEFEKFPPVLSLSGLFYEKDLTYTYEEYDCHLQQTREFAQSHQNYTVNETNNKAFRNIEIIIHEGKWAMVSKGKSPAIHFVIRHPKLRSAIENMVMPIVEA